ncbi:Glycosyltransferase [Rhynchospora pubera]|uniref:Glycosyltransferase n=1 Tax=Rhynchospora pubera TaxID=906938 RepID=A0AAV8FA03_9POAL|nr:Glycosyltransferase [Rhynchospora pubera]
MKDVVVLYTWIALGHLMPMVELAKLLSKQGMSVTVVIVDFIKNSSSFTSKTISRLSTANPTISFHVIPPATELGEGIDHVFKIIQEANTPLLYILQSISETCSVCAVVLDFFCTYALDVARQLDIPAYLFHTSGAYDLAIDIYFPTLDKNLDNSIVEIGNRLLDVPGLPPIPGSHLPDHLHRRNSPVYKSFINIFQRFVQHNGILVNTFELFEKKAVEALKAGLCFPGGYTPPVYCIGPLITVPEKKEEERHESLVWLDMQPRKSVVFLSFGSMGSFSEQQLREIATGLENSGQRFLWVVRSPAVTNPLRKLDPQATPDLQVILPEGFIDRTKDQGMVVIQWAPQVEVLNHESVGAFVTHCGWNSILEATMAGVPMICWPMYAEQKLNKIYLVEEMKVAVEMKGYDEDIVVAKEVEDKVKLIMESEKSKVIRERMETIREKAVEALREGGSSHTALEDFLKAVRMDGVPC